MSPEDVELVRSAVEAYIAGERDAYVDDFFAGDVEVFPDVSRGEARAKPVGSTCAPA